MSSLSFHALFLVDGYNVVGAWPDLRHTRDVEGLEMARYELIEALTGYSTFRGYETRLIFDSQYQNTTLSQESVTQNLSVHYTDFGQTADTLIERTCALFQKEHRRLKQRLIVATSDRAQQLTVTGYGAEWMSAQQLALELEMATMQIRRKQQSGKRSTQRLANSLDTKTFQRLNELRFGQRPSIQSQQP